MKLPRMTDAETEVLSLVLRELRHANAINKQLTILVDPFFMGDGANLVFSYNLAGCDYEVNGKIGQAKRPTPSAKVGRGDLKRFSAKARRR